MLSPDEIFDAIESSPPLERTTRAKGFIGALVSTDAFLVSATPGKGGEVQVCLKLEPERPSGFVDFRAAPGAIHDAGVLSKGAPFHVEGRIKGISGRWIVLEEAKISGLPREQKPEVTEITRPELRTETVDAGISTGVGFPAVTRYRTFWRRFWAGFVDGLVFLPVGLLNLFLSAPARGPLIIIAWSVITYSSYWLYIVVLHARYGQTLGKMATHVKVLDLEEQRIPTFRQAFLRDIGYIVLNYLSLGYLIYLVLTHQYVQGAEVSTLPGLVLAFAGLGWFILEVVTMLTNEKRRALHDYIGGTVVIRTT